MKIGMTRDGAAAARVAHNHEVPGSSPGPATKEKAPAPLGLFLWLWPRICYGILLISLMRGVTDAKTHDAGNTT